MRIEVQRLRNLTTRRLHTEVGHIYEDLEWITGESGLFTHMLPRATEAVTPWLKSVIKDSRFWDDQYDTSHTGEVDLPEPTPAERKQMWEIYSSLPNPLDLIGRNSD